MTIHVDCKICLYSHEVFTYCTHRAVYYRLVASAWLLPRDCGVYVSSIPDFPADFIEKVVCL